MKWYVALTTNFARTFAKLILVASVLTLIVVVFLKMAFPAPAPGEVMLDFDTRQRLETEANIAKMETEAKTDQDKAAITLYKKALCFLTGDACEKKDEAEALLARQNSVSSKIGQFMVLPLYYPVSSGRYVIQDTLANAGFLPKAYAAEGIGMAGLRPFNKIWKVFRDVSFLLLIIMIVIIGFMVMFRMNINPQTVISLENALPRIVITMILITFSFAIAGFLIDLMYVLISLSISVLSKADPTIDANETTLNMITAKGSHLMSSMYTKKFNFLGNAWQLGNALGDITPPIINWLLRGAAFIIIILRAWKFVHITWIKSLVESLKDITLFGFTLGDLPELVNPTIHGLIVPILAVLSVFIGPAIILMILVMVTFFAVFFRIFFMLLFSYLRILLLVIFSPIILIFEVFPGRNAFGFWFKSLIAEILVFPTTITLLVLGRVLTNLLGTVWIDNPNPRIQDSQIMSFPFLYGFSPNSFALLLGFGLMFSIPHIIKAMKELMGAKGLPLKFGLSTFIGGATGSLMGGMGIMGQFSSLYWGYTALKNAMGKTDPSKDTGRKPSGPVPKYTPNDMGPPL